MSFILNKTDQFHRSLAGLGFSLLLGSGASAGTFGVPTNIHADGRLCTGVNTPAGGGCTAAAVNPPGWFILHGGGLTNGDVPHQIRLFIEVTGTTLDVKIFDPGRNGARDVNDNGTTTTYALLDPGGTAVRPAISLGGDNGTTDNRLARMPTGAGGFVAANAGAFHTVTPGLYELRITTSGGPGDTQINAFGVDIRDGSGSPYNVYTIGRTPSEPSAFIGGRWGSSSAAPIADVSAPMPLFSYVDRGCSVIPSNFHAGNAGPATIVDALGQSTSLTLSNTGAVEQALTVETVSAVNQDSTNYGMWPLTHDVSTGAASNILDWRVADYRGWTTAPSGTAPGDPRAPIRMYLPNGYAPSGGSPNPVAPQEPILRSVYGVVSGPNPPVVGSSTRVQITTALYNAGPGAISNLILQIPLPATGAVVVAGSPVASIDGSAATCTEPGGVPGFLAGSTTAMQCTFNAAVPLDSVATLEVQVDITPSASGLFNVTGPPSLALSNLARVTTTATATTAQPHWFAVGDSVTVAGSGAPFNVTATILTVPSATTFTYTVANSGATTSSTGTVTENGGDRSALALFTPPYSSVATRSENAGPICRLTGAAAGAAVNLGITKTDAPDPVAAGGNITYTIAVNNPLGGSTAPNVSMIDVLSAGTTFQSLSVPAGWTCATPPVGGGGTVSCTRASLPGNTTSTFSLVVRVAPGTPIATVISNTATVASDGIESNPSNNSATATTTVGSILGAPACTTGATGSPASITGIVNAYYPGSANAANGATSITVGARLGAATDINPGDLLLVIQMQDAAIDSTNTAAYGGATNGTTALNNVGRYEYAVATNTVGAAGGTINLAGGLTRGPYTNAAATGTQGQRRFQVVRVPQYASTTLTSGLTAAPWNGATGGILAVDVAGNLGLGGATIDVSGLGFRGGQGRGLGGGTGTDTDYRNPAAQNVHGSKGEGMAGTPRYLWSTSGGAVDTTIDGYPNGSSARGRPGNAGGGGTDDDMGGNSQNSGGGGGGNAGAGGRGGNAWNTNATLGGLGGAAFAVAADRLVLGGGGGAGSRNNSSGQASSGGAGGGMVLIRAGSVTGAGTIVANGQMGVEPLNDGGGGGGAGGSVLVLAMSGGLGGLTVNAQGAAGTNAWPLQAPGGTPGERHGPGGGGGGGIVFLSSAAASTNVNGGAAGTTTTAADTYGAQAGGAGTVTLSGTLNSTIPAVCTLTGTADLAVTKTADLDSVLAGADITYSIVVQNLGPSTAANPVLSESVPANTTFQSLAPPAGWTCSSVPVVGGTGAFTCSIASLAAGGSATFTYSVRVNLGTAAGTVVANTATVSSTTPDTNSANNSSSAFTSVEAPLALLTRATLGGLRVDPEGRVRFATTSQHGTRQFDIFASNDPFRASDLQRVNRDPVDAAFGESRGPILYDVRTEPITTRYLYLVETERSGRRNRMGPFRVGDERLASAYDRIEKSLSEAGLEEAFAPGAQSARTLASKERRAGNRRSRETVERRSASRESRRLRRHGDNGNSEGVKIEVSQPGRVRLSRAELSAQGLPEDVPLQSVRVASFGRAVPVTVAGDGGSVTFDAEPLHTTYTGNNVYLLTWRGKPPTPTVPLSIVDPVPAGFTRINKRGVYFVYVERIDPWVWDVLTGPTWPDVSWDPEAGTFDLPGLAPSMSSAPFELKVAGYSDHTHIVEAWLNGHSLGEVRFQGQTTATLRGVVEGLQATGNRLTLSYRTAEGAPDGFAVLSHLDLGVRPVGEDAEAVVEDLSRFSPALPDFANIDTLVVTHGDFTDAAARFAALKKSEGRRVAVVDVERAYDAFSAGIVEAERVRALIQKAAKQSHHLRYVVLLGGDTFDPQDFAGLGAVSFIPSLYAPGRVPSENGYADLDGDGRPDLAIGRLPARTAEDAMTMVDKIERQAQAGAPPPLHHLIAVDNGSGEQNPFRAEAQTMAAQFAPGSSISLADIDEGIVAARSALEAGFASGEIIHYFGHGGPQTWADEHLLDVDAVPSLTGPGSVVLTWACQVQDYQYIYGPSVNEALILKPQGGAIASFGPAGITDQAEQALLYGPFYERMRSGGSLGEIIRDAKALAIERDPRVGPAIEGFNLLGDPTLVIPSTAPAPPRPRGR